jgi:hypothetical protein
MRSEHIDILVGALRQALAEPLETADEFASTAATGELLRRAALAEELEDAETTELLGRYEAALANANAPTGERLKSLLDESLDELSRYASEPRRERDPELGADALRLVDETLSVAAAAYRAGRLRVEEVHSLSLHACRGARELAPKLSELWSYALGREADVATDPDLPRLFAFWEPLAELAPERLALELEIAAYRPREERETLKQRVLERAKTAVPLARTPLIERLRQFIEGWTERLSVTVARPVPVEAYASGQGALPPLVQTLLEADGLSVLWVNDAIVVEVAEGHQLAVAVVTLSDNKPLEVDRDAPNVVRLELGSQRIGVSVDLELLIDGEAVRLPPIEFEERG